MPKLLARRRPIATIFGPARSPLPHQVRRSSKNIDVHLENDSSEPEKSESESVAAQCFQRPDYGSIEQPHSHTLMIIYSRSLFIFSLCRSFLLA